MSLRDEAITHMEGQLRHYMEDELFLGLEEIIEYDWIAGATLDALLDFLGARAAEVGEEMERAFMRADLRSEDIIGYGRGRERSQILVLVAALRGTTEEP